LKKLKKSWENAAKVGNGGENKRFPLPIVRAGPPLGQFLASCGAKTFPRPIRSMQNWLHLPAFSTKTDR
jgi:hypothetical protein